MSRIPGEFVVGRDLDVYWSPCVVQNEVYMGKPVAPNPDSDPNELVLLIASAAHAIAQSAQPATSDASVEAEDPLFAIRRLGFSLIPARGQTTAGCQYACRRSSAASCSEGWHFFRPTKTNEDGSSMTTPGDSVFTICATAWRHFSSASEPIRKPCRRYFATVTSN